MKNLYSALRYALAFFICLYGFAKINGSQFTVLYSELDKPMGEVSGFWLTWYFFGYSAVYGNLIATVQVLAGLLLTFRRTALLAAIVLFGMMSNIVLIDIFYGIDQGLLPAVFITLALAFILFQHRTELIEAFFKMQNTVIGNEVQKPWTRWFIRFSIVVMTFGFTYWIANVNNIYPTEIDGVWELETASGADAQLPEKIFFELYRRHVAVFKYPDGSYRRLRFKTVPEEQTVTIYDRESPDDPVLSAEYKLEKGKLILRGEFEGDSVEIILRIQAL